MCLFGIEMIDCCLSFAHLCWFWFVLFLLLFMLAIHKDAQE